MSCEQWVKTLDLPSLEKRGLRDNLIVLCIFLWWEREEGGAELFSLVSGDQVCGNSSKLCQGRFRVDISLWRGWSNTGTGLLERC